MNCEFFPFVLHYGSCLLQKLFFTDLGLYYVCAATDLYCVHTSPVLMLCINLFNYFPRGYLERPVD